VNEGATRGDERPRWRRRQLRLRKIRRRKLPGAALFAPAGRWQTGFLHQQRKKHTMQTPQDLWRVGDIAFSSRFLLGTARYPSPAVLREAMRAAGSQIVTVGLKRQTAASGSDNGFIDSFRTLYPEQVTYSWWSYRFKAREKNAGWRIDYFLLSNRLREQLVDARIHTEVYGSDHCPVEVELNL